MPSPDSALTTTRPDLAGSFEEFDLEMNQMRMMATRVLPSVEVQKPAGKFGILTIEHLLKKGATERASGSGYNRGDYKFDTVSFATEEHGWEEPVDDREATLYNQYFDAEQVAARRARNNVMGNLEQRVADLVFDTVVWTGATLTTAVTTEWDTLATATPIADVEGAVQNVHTNSGLIANALIIGWTVFRNLRNVAEIIDRIKYAGIDDPKNVTEQILAQVFDLEFVMVGGGLKDTALEGAASTPAMYWDDEYAMVGRVARSSDIREPCIGRIFHWGEDGSTIGGTLETYRDETVRSDIVRDRMETDEKVLYAQAGHLLTNITT